MAFMFLAIVVWAIVASLWTIARGRRIDTLYEDIAELRDERNEVSKNLATAVAERDTALRDVDRLKKWTAEIDADRVTVRARMENAAAMLAPVADFTHLRTRIKDPV